MSDLKQMQCMEVWGGNRVVDSGVMMPGLDAWVYSQPYQEDGETEVGGDVHYLSSCATGRITRFLVADVSGHGASVAEVAKVLRKLMKRHINWYDQGNFIRSLNREFTLDSSTDGSFATAVVMTFEAFGDKLSVSNAGHPPPLIYRAASRVWAYVTPEQAKAKTVDQQLAIADVPLGIIDSSDYAKFSIKVKKGDLVLCYTDGLIEARDATGEMLGMDGLLKIARTVDTSEPAAVITNLLKAIESLRPGNLANDDITCLLMRPNGLWPKIPLSKIAMGPFRWMKSAINLLRPLRDEPDPLPEGSA